MSSIQKLEQTVTEKFSRLGWDQLTPIQSKAYPVILRQRNALLVAPTGSGKTEAAIVPIIAFLAKESRSRKGIGQYTLHLLGPSIEISLGGF